MKRALCFGLVALAALLGTWALGWWSVALLALAAGLLGCRAGLVSAASATAWIVLLGIDAASGNISRIATALAGVMGIPSAALYFITVALPALLGWSAASLADAARSLRSTSRQPS